MWMVVGDWDNGGYGTMFVGFASRKPTCHAGFLYTRLLFNEKKVIVKCRPRLTCVACDER